MIYVTGDTHGRIERICENPEIEKLGKGDILIVCGDFGFVFATKGTMLYLSEYESLKKLESKPYTVLFVDGNHENFDRLDSYPTEIWNGGKVHRIGENILHLMRGQVFEIEGKRIFTMGGAHSFDKYIRTEGVSWWRAEIPSEEELEEAKSNLAKCDNKVDFVITHTAPKLAVEALGFSPSDDEEELISFFDFVLDNVSFKRWYFGHWHTDRKIADGIYAVYNYVDTL